MKKLLILFAGIVSLALLASCAKDEANLSGSISGLVTEYASANTPIAGATVTLNGKGLSKTTGSDGRFEFSNLEPGTYTIAVKANNFQANTKQVTVYAGQKANCDVQLTVEKVSIDISPMNLVFDKTVDQLSLIITNQSTRDLSYNLASYMQELEVSPMLGSIKAKGQQAINVKVTNRASVKKTVSGQIIVSVGSDSYQVNVTINGTEEEVTTGNVMGTITDYANANAPIAGATVTLSTTGQSKTTGSDGRYEFTELTPGKYTITVSANEYEGSKKDVTIEAGKNVTCDFQLQKGAADVTVTPQSLTYASDVDQLSFTIKNGSSSTQQYTVSNVPEFASVSSSTGMVSSKGSEAIMVTIPNRKQIKEKKSGQLTVNVGNNAFVVSLSVEPYQEEPVNVDIAPQTLNFDANTEQLTFTMTSKNNRELNYAITSDLNILTVTPTKGTLKEKGKSTITVNVQDRQKIDIDRVGKLTIDIEGNTYVVAVNVAKYDVNVNVSPQNLSFNNDTEQLTFSITNNNAQTLDYSISSDLDDILTVSPNKGNINAKEKKDIIVRVKNRKDITTDKSGELTIIICGRPYTASVYISKAQTDASISPQTLTFDKNTEQLSFTITNNNVWANSYSVSSNLSNLTLSPSTGSISSKVQQVVTVKVNDRKNVTSDQSGKITVTIGGSVYSVDVSVAKYDVDVNVSPQTLSFNNDTEQLTFSITNNNAQTLDYSISSDLDGVLTISPNNGNINAKEKKDIVVSVKNRKDITADKSGKLTIVVCGRTYTVNVNISKAQTDASISPQTLTFDKNTEQLSFTITNNNVWANSYSVSSNLSNLTLSPSTGSISSKGQQAVTVKVNDRKNVTSDQSGQITINVGNSTYTVNVNISKAQTDVSISPQTLTFDKNTEQLSFTIANNNIWANSYSVSSSLSCLTLSPSTGSVSAKGQQAVTVKVNDRKNVTSDQSGQITINVGNSAYTVNVNVKKYEQDTPNDEQNVVRGLVAYYNFNKGNADDAIGGYHGFENGGTYITDTPNGSGKALYLKQKQSISIGSAPLDGKTNYSVSMWVKDFGSGPLLITKKDKNYTAPSVVVTEDVKFRFYTGYANYYNAFSADMSNYQSGKWTMVTIVCEPTGGYKEVKSTLYINGRKVDSGTSGTTNASGGTAMVIGGEASMKIDNVRLYSVSLKDEEVEALYQYEK